MSELPAIDPKAVINRLSSKVADLTSQVTQLELLAEALRDERDEARTQAPVEGVIVEDTVGN
jgi:outer membrane murein-binding lipoprotein Lpp